MTKPPISALKLSKADLEEHAEQFRDKAQTAHREARFGRNRALTAEAQLTARTRPTHQEAK